jgi:integrase
MTKKARYGDGAIDQRGENTFRLRYRIGKQRYAVTFTGTHAEAKKKLRELLRSGDTGEHVGPNKDTLADWAKQWIAAGAPGRKRVAVGQRALERYDQLLRTHVLPMLGEYKLQQLNAADIDALYLTLEGKIAPSTARATHNVLGACLGAAVRTRKLAINPMLFITKAPARAEGDHGIALDDQELKTLLHGFRGHSLFAIVSVAAFTGCRRGELLALRWSDLDANEKTLRIERAIEQTDKHGLRFKGPKKERHKRTIKIDDDLVALLLSEREKHLRLVAGVADGVFVDLSLIRLPEGALMFPDPEALIDGKFTLPRSPVSVTKIFDRKAARIGFPNLRLHDLRGTHETLLLDRGVPVHVVAARCGHDPATLLQNYAKRTRKADTSAAGVINSISKGILGS